MIWRLSVFVGWLAAFAGVCSRGRLRRSPLFAAYLVSLGAIEAMRMQHLTTKSFVFVALGALLQLAVIFEVTRGWPRFSILTFLVAVVMSAVAAGLVTWSAFRQDDHLNTAFLADLAMVFLLTVLVIVVERKHIYVGEFELGVLAGLSIRSFGTTLAIAIEALARPEQRFAGADIQAVSDISAAVTWCVAAWWTRPTSRQMPAEMRAQIAAMVLRVRQQAEMLEEKVKEKS